MAIDDAHPVDPEAIDRPVVSGGEAELFGGFDDPAGLSAGFGATEHHIPGYRLLRLLGRGAQSVVYLAEQESTRRLVAVKMMGAGQLITRHQRARFEREADIVATLKHPGIVVLFDRLTLAGGRVAMVLEYVRGVRLDRWREEHARTDPVLARRAISLMIAEIADAVNHAHQNGVAHRDLKPSNILVDRDDRPHVLDFGVAKLLQQDGVGITATGDEPATLAYASPEQIDGGSVDQRTDVYSLGVICFELLTGVRPFQSLTARSAMFRAMREARAPSARSLDGSIEADLSAIVAKCLEFEPERRYQTPSLLAADLRRFIAGEPIDIRSDSFGYLVRKLASAHSLALSLAAVAVVLILASVAWLAVMYQHSHSLYLRATAEKDRADQTLTRLGDVLARSRIDLGRQLAVAGVVHTGEAMLWEQLFDTFHHASDSPRPAESARRVAVLWGLRELYHRDPCLSTRDVYTAIGGGSIAVRGDRVVWASARGEVVEFDAVTTEQLGSWKFLAKDDGDPLRCFVCEDGEHMIVATTIGEQRMTRWSLTERRPLASLPVTIESKWMMLRMSRDGSRALVERSGSGIDLVDFGAGEVRRFLPELEVRAAEFGAGESIWLQTTDNQLLRAESPSGPARLVLDINHAASFEDVKNSSRWFGSLRVNAEGTRAMVLLAARPWLVTMSPIERAVPVRSIAPRVGTLFTSDGRLICPENEQRLADVDLETGGMRRSAGGHPSLILNVIEDPARDRLVSSDSFGTIKWWPSRLGPISHTILPEERSGLIPTDLQTLADGFAAFTNNVGELRVVDLASGTTRELHRVHAEYASALQIDESRSVALTVGYEGLVREWTYPQWEQTGELSLGAEIITSVTLAGEKGTWCAGTDSGRLFFGRLHPFEVVDRYEIPRSPRVAKLRFGRNGASVAAATSDGRIIVWSPGGPKPIEEYAVAGRPMRRLVWLSDARIVVGRDDGLISAIDTSSGEITTSDSGHPGPVAGLEDWPEEGVFVSVDRGGELRVWDRHTLQQLSSLRLGNDPVSELAIDHERRSIVVVAMPQRISWWSLAETDACLRGNLEYQLGLYANAERRESSRVVPSGRDVQSWIDASHSAPSAAAAPVAPTSSEQP